MLMADKQPVIIVGGGIGGLAAALAVANAGHRCLVLERARAFGEIGAGIQIGPNAFHAFDRLGVGNAARREAVYVDHLRLMDGLGGEEICHIPLGDSFRAFFKNPYAVVHRADLHRVLLDAVETHGDIELRPSSHVAGFSQDDDGVAVKIDGEAPFRGALLVGADGLHSVVRAAICNDGAPRVSGHTTFRSVIPTDRMPDDLRWNAATLWAGPKCHIVHYPLKGGDVFNLVVTCHNDVTEPVSGQPVDREVVRRGFEHVHPCARQIIEHGDDWKLWVLCDRDPNPNWVQGRAVLLGDAAHPMLQYFAQGACMALEDAVCLGDCLALDSDLAVALETYRTARFARTARVQLASRLIGDYVYHPADGLAATRNAIMAAKSPDEWYSDLAWLYGGPPPVAATRAP